MEFANVFAFQIAIISTNAFQYVKLELHKNSEWDSCKCGKSYGKRFYFIPLVSHAFGNAFRKRIGRARNLGHLTTFIPAQLKLIKR